MRSRPSELEEFFKARFPVLYNVLCYSEYCVVFGLQIFTFFEYELIFNIFTNSHNIFLNIIYAPQSGEVHILLLCIFLRAGHRLY